MVDMPVKASGTKISRMLKSKKACPYCFPHGPETPNATAKKNNKNWKKSLMLLGIYLGFVNLNSGGITGNIYGTYNNLSSENATAEFIINDGSSGTKTIILDSLGYYSFSTTSFTPQPFLSDTIKMGAEKIDGGKTYSAHAHKIRGSDNTIMPTLFLDDPDKNVVSQAINILKVKDESVLEDTLRAKAWLQKNPNQKIDYVNLWLQSTGSDSTLVDTSDIYPQVFINLEKQDSTWNLGDTVIIELYKTIGNTEYYDEFKIPIDTLKHGMATVEDSVVYKGDTTRTTALNQFSYNYNIKGDTVIMNYENDNALGYKISRKDNNQGDFKLISFTEKSQYKDVVPNGSYDYSIQALGNNGKVLNEQKFKVKKLRGIEKNIKKVIYLGQRELREQMKECEVYDITGKQIKDVSRLSYGIYLVKDRE
ncbi:MAG: hypothetical protein AB7T10_03770 [bacterium]